MQNVISAFHIDPNLILAITGLLLTIFVKLVSCSYMRTGLKEYYIVNIVYIISFLMVIFAKNWIVFFSAWEFVMLITNKKYNLNLFEYLVLILIGVLLPVTGFNSEIIISTVQKIPFDYNFMKSILELSIFLLFSIIILWEKIGLIEKENPLLWILYLRI